MTILLKIQHSSIVNYQNGLTIAEEEEVHTPEIMVTLDTKTGTSDTCVTFKGNGCSFRGHNFVYE